MVTQFTHICITWPQWVKVIMFLKGKVYICIMNNLLYSDVIMGAMASQITNLTIVYSTVYSGTDQRKHQSSMSLAFVRGIHQWPVNSPHKWPVTQKMFPFDYVIMLDSKLSCKPIIPNCRLAVCAPKVSPPTLCTPSTLHHYPMSIPCGPRTGITRHTVVPRPGNLPVWRATHQYGHLLRPSQNGN